MKAVIPAAGLGTRFLPATKALPKEMLPLLDKPCIQYVVEEALAAGITEIVIVTGREKRAIEEHFAPSPELERRLSGRIEEEHLRTVQEITRKASIVYVRQEEPLGLGHAVLSAKKHVDGEPFAVMLGDNIVLDERPAIGRLIDASDRLARRAVIGIFRVPRSEASKYGIVSGQEMNDGLYRIDRLVEKPEIGTEPSDLAVFGRYVFPPEILDHLESTSPGLNREIQLTDGMSALAEQQEMYGLIVPGRRFDIGSKLDWLRANIEIALRRPGLGEALHDWIEQRVCRGTRDPD